MTAFANVWGSDQDTFVDTDFITFLGKYTAYLQLMLPSLLNIDIAEIIVAGMDTYILPSSTDIPSGSSTPILRVFTLVPWFGGP